MDTIKEKIKAVMLGHAVGDALGVPVEFCKRDELDKKPVTDMVGYGTYPYPEGCWSDDTSMSLAALDSLCNGTVDWDDIMRNFGKWLENDEYTPTGENFDAGRTCVKSIVNYFAKQIPATQCGETDEYSNGNGSLMRIHPFVLYAYCKNMSCDKWIDLIHSASALTHAHERSKVGCGIYSYILIHLLNVPHKSVIWTALSKAESHYRGNSELKHYQRLFQSNFDKLDRSSIKSSGYVVDTLEAAVWCVLTTDNYRDCVLKAVNLGDDTDTVAAVVGGLAGALYGCDAIPKEWLDVLKRRAYIENICDRAIKNWI